MVLEEHLSATMQDRDIRKCLGLCKNLQTKQHPFLLAKMHFVPEKLKKFFCFRAANRSQVTEMLKDTSLIPDPVLAKEVHIVSLCCNKISRVLGSLKARVYCIQFFSWSLQCVLNDSVYGCIVDTIKQYPWKQQGVSFITQCSSLRSTRSHGTASQHPPPRDTGNILVGLLDHAAWELPKCGTVITCPVRPWRWETQFFFQRKCFAKCHGWRFLTIWQLNWARVWVYPAEEGAREEFVLFRYVTGVFSNTLAALLTPRGVDVLRFACCSAEIVWYHCEFLGRARL